MHKDSMHDFTAYIPIKNAVQKLTNWENNGAEILYLTSRTQPNEIENIRNVLKSHKFPEGKLFYRKNGEKYQDIAERIVPDILVEDDCESIGGTDEMTITHVKPEIKDKIKSIPVKEFGGIDHLPDRII